ncbi:MAG: hypothetical protein COA78_29050 [Blastopirellula sp.]|nr:MAG: hypothetical protein COA78_29050 [Blastopirellula sp.]
MVSSILDSTPLVLTIDLHLSQDHRDLATLRKLNDFTRTILEGLAKNQLVATFGLDDPGHSQLAELIQKHGNHEIAIFADDCWSGAGVNNRVFSNELVRRIESSRRQGIQIHSLLLETSPSEENWRSIRGSEVIAVRTGRLRKPAISPCQGVWDIATSTVYPVSNQWLPGLSKSSIPVVSCTSENFQPLHLLISGESAIRNRQMLEPQIQTLLEQCRDLKSRNAAQLYKLSELARLLNQEQHLGSLHSVRKAA